METNGKGALAKKLAKILGEVGKVPKTGFNSFHKYNYVTENDLVYAVRDKLSEAGIFVFSSVESQHAEIIEGGDGKKSLLTTVTTKHTFVDGDSGEEFSVLSQGQGSDNGDKGGYKAITGAMKYFLYKCFMIPTGDDPEGDDKTDKRAAEGAESKSGTGGASSQRPANTDRPAPPVPRTDTTPDALRDQFRQNAWHKVKIHFGNDKGLALGAMDEKKLEYWIGWQPKPFRGKIAQDDILLRAALDVADEEWQ